MLYLWVSEDQRRQGLGSEVLARLETEARERGCTDALIETFDDSTTRLYERLGYERVTSVPNYVGPFTKHVLIKSGLQRSTALRAAGSSSARR